MCEGLGEEQRGKAKEEERISSRFCAKRGTLGPVRSHDPEIVTSAETESDVKLIKLPGTLKAVAFNFSFFFLFLAQ